MHFSTAATVPNIFTKSICQPYESQIVSLIGNPEILHTDVQRFKRLGHTFVSMLVVGMAAFNSWIVSSLLDHQPRAIRLPVLSTADSYR